MSTTTTRIALALDTLVREYPDVAQQFAAAFTPVHMADQLDAAAQQWQQAIARAAEDGMLNERVVMTADQHPDWLRLGVLHTLAAWVDGTGSTCMHSPDPRRPMPVAAAAWKPDLVICTSCTHLLSLPDNDTDRTCDACGRVTTGPEHDDSLTTGALTCGPLRYFFGVCRACEHWAPGSTAA